MDTTFWDVATMLENWEIISAFLLPLIVAIPMQYAWPRGVKAAFTFGVALVWTVIKYAIEGGLSDLTVDNLIPSALTIFALTIPFYYGLWKPTGAAPAIEQNVLVSMESRRLMDSYGIQDRRAA